mgnify:CR=1
MCNCQPQVIQRHEREARALNKVSSVLYLKAVRFRVWFVWILMHRSFWQRHMLPPVHVIDNTGVSQVHNTDGSCGTYETYTAFRAMQVHWYLIIQEMIGEEPCEEEENTCRVHGHSVVNSDCSACSETRCHNTSHSTREQGQCRESPHCKQHRNMGYISDCLDGAGPMAGTISQNGQRQDGLNDCRTDDWNVHDHTESGYAGPFALHLHTAHSLPEV